MNRIPQYGHALSTTMIIMILLSLLSLTALRNGLMDAKIAQTFDQHQLYEERQLSALRFVESTVIPDLINPDTTLFRDFAELESGEPLQIPIPIRSSVRIAQIDHYLDPVLNVSRIPNSSQDFSTPPTTARLLAEVLDRNTGHQLIATFQYLITEEFPTGEAETIKRLSLRKNTG